MSYMLLSGLLLTMHPASTHGAECYYPVSHHLSQILLSKEYNPDFQPFKSSEPELCWNDFKEESYLSVSDIRIWLASHIPPSQEYDSAGVATTLISAPFEPASLLVEPQEDLSAEVISDDASDEENLPVDGGEATSSVFSVMNATIPTTSAPAPVWRPLLSQKARGQHFVFPLRAEPVVTSPFGMRYHPIIHTFMRHEGVDLRAALNSEVMSIADGMVTETGYGPVTGLYMTIRHPDGWSSRYLHLNKLLLVKNQYVQKGDVIALSGNTGRTDGPHLHLEIIHDDKLLDPMTLLFEPAGEKDTHPALQVVSESLPTPASEPEPVDMTPKIAVIAGEGESLQIGVRTGRKMTMYSPQEIVETDEGNWRIVSKFGKYKLQKMDQALSKATK
ncbi:M23 family metallopeptidase [Enterobacter sp. V87_3]|uniref:M23 family metallopeptidase n=1 Tax=Enterobacter sp. V87_3 TaxID=3044236 RepID=UPI00249F5BFE|nr:M23 family metallopeptidase [Enterobacter sp. V87_3]MDI3426963.1 M23 family metallopeptidase [Enterobacter sp. V87_3]HDS6852058.1 M23 family metallopeptidase [Enterobacter cancerogenus]